MKFELHFRKLSAIRVLIGESEGHQKIKRKIANLSRFIILRRLFKYFDVTALILFDDLSGSILNHSKNIGYSKIENRFTSFFILVQYIKSEQKENRLNCDAHEETLFRF